MFQSAGGVKTDNNPAGFKAKVTIRRNVLNMVGQQSAVFDAFEVAAKKFLYAVRPAIDLGESRLPTHLPPRVLAIVPP